MGTDPTIPTSDAAPASRPLLVVLDQDDSIVVIEEDGSVVDRYDPPPDVRYTQPIWASSEVIVAGQIAIDDNQLFATRVGVGEEWSVRLPTPPFYYLAKAVAGEVTVVSLRNDTDSNGLIAEIVDGSGSIDLLGDESPFYMSWDPNSDRLAAHVAGERIDVVDGGIETISTSTGVFHAPVWLADGLATLETRDGTTFLSIWDGSTFTALGEVQGSARFVGAGTRIAIQGGEVRDNGGVRASLRVRSGPSIPTGVLTVVDVETGELATVTSATSPFYQWDPGGNRLLYTTVTHEPEPALVWHVWEDGVSTTYGSFVPDPTWFGSFVPFFDQYAQSVSLWSPDGTAFAYPALVDDEPRILIQTLEDPFTRNVAGGEWVAWAP